MTGRASDGLVFARVEDGVADLFRARIADGAEAPLRRTPDRHETWPYWSEIAGRLVFQGVELGESPRADLYLWSPEAGEVRVTETPRREERWPAWSPVDTRLVFAFRGGRPAAGVALVDPVAGTGSLLAATGALDFFFRPSFVPDGGRVVAQRRDASGRGSSLWLLAPDAPPRPVTSDASAFDQKAFFTRDGGRIVFSRRPVAGGDRDVWSVAPDGGALRALVSGPDDAHSARPSPTRDEIAFVSDREGSADVFVQDLAEGSPRRLTATPRRHELAPRWSPDGERLVVVASLRPEQELRLTDHEALEAARLVVLGRDGRELLDVPGLMADWMPAW